MRTYRDVQINRKLYRKARQIATGILAAMTGYIILVLWLCQGR